MVKQTYDHRDFKSLGDVENVRLNPGMYISQTSNPVHLIEEALDNALDECLAGFATIIAINIDTKKHIYSVLDNGRGIPFTNDIPELISTKLFTGAKFKGSKTVYEITSGLHGVGLVAVNALSENYIVEVFRENKHAIFKFENSKLKEKKIEDYTDQRPFSTKIEFKPDKKIFETLLPDLKRVRDRLLVASVELSDCTFVLNVDEKKEVIKLDKDSFFKEHCLSENDSELTPMIETEVKDGIESFSTRFCYATSGPISPKIQSSINLLPVESGGTHVTIFVETLRNLFSAAGKKSGIKFQPQDSITGLRTYLNLELKEPEFSGQTKDRLINRRSYFEKLENKLSQSIEKILSNSPELLQSLLKHFEDYRQRLDLRKMKITSGNGKRASTTFTKLRDCTNRNGELFIVEGDSAESGLIQCRDAKSHAILPLKGKVPSVMNVKDIIDNIEIKEIIKALGIGLYPNINISNLRYNKVIILTDADPDGEHIASILILDLAILVPDLIKTGHLFLAKTPLYSINDTKRGIFLPLWSQEEVDAAIAENKPILRAKGLGELNPEQLKVCAIDIKTRKLYQVKYTNNLEKLSKLFSDVNTKRELLEGKFKL
jgi:DNA gyrase/topoisomerase IV subunit B